MKKIVTGLLSLVCCIMLLGCNAEEKTYDQNFLDDLKQGLIERWNLSNELLFDSKESGEKFVNAEENLTINGDSTFTQTVEVEKPLTGWQSFKMTMGGWMLGIIIFLIVCVILYFVKPLNLFKL